MSDVGIGLAGIGLLFLLLAMRVPIGMALALGRRSAIPLIRIFSITFIEFWRGVPLITVLFFATYMLPLFLPVSPSPLSPQPLGSRPSRLRSERLRALRGAPPRSPLPGVPR